MSIIERSTIHCASTTAVYTLCHIIIFMMHVVLTTTIYNDVSITSSVTGTSACSMSQL